MRPRILELRAGKPGQSMAWSELYMSASIERTKGKRPNKGKIEIYNLSDESIAYLEQCTAVQVLAGEDTPTLLFEGDLGARDVKTRLEGVDRITTIEAGDGREAYRSGAFSRSYPEGTSRAEVLTDVLAASGLSVGYVTELPQLDYAGGLTLSGRLRDVLDEVLGSDAEWTIQDGHLEVYAPGEAHPALAVVIAPDSGLIGSPERTDKGISLQCVLLPQLRPGRLVRVESRMVSGWYRTTKVSHECDSRGITWQTSIEAVAAEGG